MLEVSTRSLHRQRSVESHCSEGVAVLRDGYSDHIELAWSGSVFETQPRKVQRRSVSTEMPLMRELRAFVEHLQGGPPPRSSAAEGTALVETVAHLRQLGGLITGGRNDLARHCAPSNIQPRISFNPLTGDFLASL